MDIGSALTDGIRAGLGINAASYALAAVGLNLQYGFTGLLNFGQVGFLLVGAVTRLFLWRMEAAR